MLVQAFVVVGDSNGHVGLGVKCAKEVSRSRHSLRSEAAISTWLGALRYCFGGSSDATGLGVLQSCLQAMIVLDGCLSLMVHHCTFEGCARRALVSRCVYEMRLTGAGLSEQCLLC